tara:strand:- start:956 stop:1507 length:552 start_codon:yes stop_codon:yes gene_type:complete
MSELLIGGHTAITQTGTDPPALASSMVSIYQIQTNSITTTVVSSTGSISSPVWVDVISKDITPVVGTTIIVCLNFVLGANHQGHAMWRVLRDTTRIDVNTDSGLPEYRMSGHDDTGRFPGNSIGTIIPDVHGADGSTVVVYKLQMCRSNLSHDTYIGESMWAATDAAKGHSAATHITLFEVLS